MKSKIILYLTFVVILFPYISLAAVNLPWSTGYNCADWTQSNGLYNVNCDGLTGFGNWTCDNGDGTIREEQITVSANYPSGAGGKGQRHWLGDGIANGSGEMRVEWSSTPQNEIWIRWYMRFENGFRWNPLDNYKILTVNPGYVNRTIFNFVWTDQLRIFSDGYNGLYYSAVGDGWRGIMGGVASDGQWHLYEIHLKMDTNGNDGIAEAWVDGIKRVSYTNANYGGLQGAPGWSALQIASNANTPSNGRCMFVDYDDITISNTGRIGGNTPPPSGGNPPSNNTGNDSSASGGSGCGFVKDDGKGQGAKSEGLAFAMMLIIMLATIAIAKMALKRRTTSKAGGKTLNFKSALIGLTVLLLFAIYTPAYATIYFYFDAEDGNVGANLPNPPICQTECSGSGARGTYQSNGGSPQGYKYFQWETVDNQTNAYTEIHPSPGFPITSILGKTYYLAYFFNFSRINGNDIWHETGQSGDKGVELWGSGLRWAVGGGHWPSHADNQDHRYTMMAGNATYHLNPELEVADGYVQNQSGYNANNPLQLQYEHWYSAVMAVKMATDNTGSFTVYIDGIKIYEYNNIKTIATTSATITDIKMGGTIAQGAYDAPSHYRKFDALILTDNWQDIVNGGYLNSDTPPPSGGNGGNSNSSDSSASGGSGCGFVKEDGKGQGAKGEGVSMMILLFLLLILFIKKKANHLLRAMVLKDTKGGFAKTTLFFITTAFIFLLFMGISHAADYYVSPTGAAAWTNCSGPTPLNGTSACSWQTAMANAVAGDIVYFRGGTYNVGVIGSQRDQANMRPTNSGISGNPITFIAYTGEVPNITGTVINGSTAAYFGCSYTDYIIWDGFASTMQIYTNADGSSTETQTWGSWGSNYCTIRNSNFTGVLQPYYNNTSFVRVEGSNYALVENNYFHDLTSVQGVSINTSSVYLFNSNHTIVKNNTMENTYGGVFTKLANSYVDIYNNFIHNGTNAGYAGIQTATGIANYGINIHNNIIVGYSIGINVIPTVAVDTYIIFNNTIYSGTDTHDGIHLGSATINAEVYNNIIANLSPSLRYFDGVASYSNYNNFYRAAGNVWNRNYATDYTSLSAWTAATGLDANSITSDPLFVNAGGANPVDYKLQVNSPAGTSGRGGSYATVMGAYITGNETIGYDPDAPRVEITSPPNSTVTTTNTSITLQGTASDTLGIVSVTCNNSRGGNCACTGTTNWTCSNIPLQSGQNIITVTVTDGDNKTGIDTLAVTVTTSGGGSTPPPSSDGSGSGDSSTSGGSGCGFVEDDGKGQGAKGEGVALMMLLIITLATIAIARRVFKMKTSTAKTRGKLLNFKSGLIVLTLLFLFVAYTPANATVYHNLNAEGGTVGATVPNPPFCQTECGGLFEKATYQSNGGTPQGSKYYQWQTFNNQTEHRTEVFPTGGSITNIMGKTFYLAYYFRFDRINGLDIWHEGTTIQSFSKETYIWGSNLRWGITYGQHESHAANQDHRYSITVIDSTAFNLNPELKVVDHYVQNQNGYNRNNPIQLQYEQWHSAVFAVKIASDKTGSFTLYIDGVKVYEYNNIQTVLNNSPAIDLLNLGGTLAQPAYDAPAHISKWDAILLTDNWQDIVDGAYLSSDTPPPLDGGDTPLPSSSSSSGDSSASGGSGCGFVKDDGKGQGAKGEGLTFAILLIITLAGMALARRTKRRA